MCVCCFILCLSSVASNQYNKLGLNERATFRMQLKKLVSHVKAGWLTHFVFISVCVCVCALCVCVCVCVCALCVCLCVCVCVCTVCVCTVCVSVCVCVHCVHCVQVYRFRLALALTLPSDKCLF